MKNNYGKLLSHDLRAGLLCQWKKLLPAVLLFVIPCLLLSTKVNTSEIAAPVTFGDLLGYTFRGMEVYLPVSGKQFEIPITWLALQLYLAFLVGGYADRDLREMGPNLLIRSKKRVQWWLSKCGWNCILVAAYYSLGYVVLFGFSACFGRPTLALTAETAARYYGTDVLTVDRGEFFFAAVAVPLFVSCAVSLLQMSLTLYVKPVYCYTAVAALMLGSAYCFSPALIGNYSMLARSSVVNPEGLSPWAGIAVSFAVAAAGVLLGALRIRTYDILEKS